MPAKTTDAATPHAKSPRKSSALETKFADQLRFSSLPAHETEVRFHPVRRWRFDFAWPEQKIAAEIEGGTWTKGAHSRGKHFESDCEKYNAAVTLGWRILRFTTDMVSDGRALATLKEIFEDEHETVALDTLVLDPANARLHPTQNIESIKGSLAKFGQQKPIVVGQGNVVIAGNGQLEAARALGWKEMRIVRSQLRGSDATAFGIADNATGLSSEWNDERLASLIASLRAEEYPMDALGLSEEELTGILRDADSDSNALNGDPDEVPDEAEVETRCKAGDLWQLGRHRLLCGDSTIPANLERLMNGAKATLVFTDPPYGVAIGAKNRLLTSMNGGETPSGMNLTDIVDDDLSADELKTRLLPAFKNARLHMTDDCSMMMTAPQGGDLGLMMQQMLSEAGLPVRHILIWKKNAPTFSMGRLDYDYQHEPILFTWGKRHKNLGRGAHKTSIWEIDKPRASPEHPTMKPVELIVNAMLNHTDVGDAVLDIYCGSGSTLVAAEQENRVGYGIEISPAYCDVILTRWEKLSGQIATLV